MPIAVFKSVREVSSEDANHVAANLLKDITGKKWKTLSVGEKTAHVILEFEEPQQIVGIDVGNEHAAFIEVLVSKSGCNPEDFKEILLSSSFMTPIESKSSKNVNRVRCFNSDTLNSHVLEDKWKLVKIICTQPFNKHVQYGLSFIKVHVSAPAVSKSSVPPVTLLNQALKASSVPLKLREESPESDGTDGSKLFQRWKATRNSGGKSEVSTAAAIRDASLPASLNQLNDSQKTTSAAIGIRESSRTCFPASTSDSSPLASTSRSITSSPLDGPPVLDRNRDELLYGNDDLDDSTESNGAAGSSAKKQRLKKHIEEDKKRLDKKLKTSQKTVPTQSNYRYMRTSLYKIPAKMENAGSPKANEKNEEKTPNKESTKYMDEGPSCSSSQKRKSNVDIESSAKRAKQELDNTIKTKVRYVPFNQLLSGVTLVISGIQNPDRADLRKMAKAMGAKYKPNWGTGCTHLICAFRNSPKYKQVKAKGRGKIVSPSWVEKCYELKKYLPWRRYALDPAQLNEPESDEELVDELLKPKLEPPIIVNDISERPEPQKMDSPSDPDTEDELERVAQIKKLMHKAIAVMKPSSDENCANNSNRNQPRDVFDEDTEEEDYLSKVMRDN